MSELITEMINLLQDDDSPNGTSLRKRDLLNLLKVTRENQNRPSHKKLTLKDGFKKFRS